MVQQTTRFSIRCVHRAKETPRSANKRKIKINNSQKVNFEDPEEQLTQEAISEHLWCEAQQMKPLDEQHENAIKNVRS